MVSNRKLTYLSNKTQYRKLSFLCKQTRKFLISELFKSFEEILHINKTDIEIILQEIPKENFAFRGISGDEAILDYNLNE